jgi:uncharacterized protein YecT (DUF1311 family)/uncharacterized caspase-like protein
MKRLSIPLAVALLTFLTSPSIRAQTLEQQFGRADAELNRVYKVYRAGLPDDQKAALRVDQRQWLVQLEEALKTKSSADDKLKLRIAMTATRIADLNKMMAAGQPDLLADLTSQQRANRDHNLGALRKADAELNAVYQQVLGLLPASEQEKFRQEQREWLARASGGVPFEKHRDLVAAIGLVSARTFQLKAAAAKAVAPISEQAAVTFPAESFQSAPVSVTPQGSMIDQLDSISTSSDGRFVCLVGQNIAEIWSTDDNSLLHCLNLPCQFARLLPDQALLLGVGQHTFSSDVTYTGSEARGYPSRLTGVSLLSRQRLFSCELGLDESERISIVNPWRKGYFISNDGGVVVEQYLDSMGDDVQEGFAVCLSPSVSLSAGKVIFNSGSYDPSSNRLLGKASTRQSLSQALSRPTEVKRDVGNLGSGFLVVSDAEASSRSFDSASRLILDSSISLDRKGDKIIVEWLKDGRSWKVPAARATAAGLAVAANESRLAVFGADTIRIADGLTLQSKKLTVPDAEIIAAAFSPTGTRLAVLSRERVSGTDASLQSPQAQYAYKGTVFDLVSGTVVSATSVAGDVIPEVRSGKQDLRWLESGIFLSGGAKFDDHFKIVALIPKSFFPASRLQPEVLVRADEKSLLDERERMKSAESVTIIDPSTLEQVGNARYDASNADPTCPNLPPFDIAASRKQILKGWKYWRGGGGMFLLGPKGKWEFDSSIGAEMPVFCALSGPDSVLALYPHPDGMHLKAALLTPSSGDDAMRTTASNAATAGSTPKAVVDIPIGSAYQMAADSSAFYGVEPNGSLTKYGIKAHEIKPLANYIIGESGAVAMTPDQYYLSSGNAYSLVRFTRGLKSFPFEQFDLRLNRPDIVLERLGAPDEAVGIAKQLREKRLKRMGVTEEMLKPDFHVPELEIIGDVPSTTEADEISLAIKASDSKYPLERLKVFVNNVPVNGRDGESLRDQNAQSLERTVPIKLAAGRNKIQVSILNNAGAESLYANAEVNCTAKRPKPMLYAVAMGVSEYSNSDWNLKYAAKDARDVLARLKARGGDNYGEVKELLLTDKDVTKENLAKVRDFLKSATIDDTVLMFAAGHGLLDSKYDYYFGTTDIDFNNPADKGIAFEEFDDILADLPCLKKSLLVDTCHAGELDEDEKTLLATASTGASAPLPTGKGIAMRSIGTRGMNVKAIEGARGASEWYDRLRGLFVDLRRGSGSTILTSAAGAEYALESSEQQNGLFTYAVLEALDGKKDADTNKDGSVQMSELGEYVKKRVTELTNNKQTPNTRRVNLEGDFSLAKTR